MMDQPRETPVAEQVRRVREAEMLAFAYGRTKLASDLWKFANDLAVTVKVERSHRE